MKKVLGFAVLVLAVVLHFSCTSDIESAEQVLAQAESSGSSLSGCRSAVGCAEIPADECRRFGAEVVKSCPVSSSSLLDGVSSSSFDGVLGSSSSFSQSASVFCKSTDGCAEMPANACPILGGEVVPSCPRSSSSDGGNQCPDQSGDVFTDPRDCKAYRFETAPDGKIWMSENLNYSRNNTLGYCYGVDIDGTNPHQDASGCERGYGRVYEYATAIDGNPPQGLCPPGWHIPNITEWNSIIHAYNSRIMSFDFYIYPGNYNTNSEYPPLGWKERDKSGFYWTSSDNAYFVGFWDGPASSYYSPSSPSGVLEIQSFENDGIAKFSVRCLKDYLETISTPIQPKEHP